MTDAVILIPDGVGVRNFVLGKFLRLLSESVRPSVFHSMTNQVFGATTAELNGSVRWYPLLDYQRDPVTLGLHYTLHYAHLYWADTESMRHSRNKPITGSGRMRALLRATRMAGKALASPPAMQRLAWLQFRMVQRRRETEYYRQLFGRIRPSVVFSSNQLPSVVVPAILAARRLGIPTATFVFSWDNITSKGRFAAPFDHYMVWGDQMRRELLRYYPEIGAERVHVVGTPQFEPYSDPALFWSREKFFRHIGADPMRPLICYSGGDAGTCPEDPDHVRILLQLVRSGRIRGNPRLLLRPVPVDDGRRYAALRREFPELIFAQPQWIHIHPGDWRKVMPTKEDVTFLVNLARHADLNVNLGSTMTLDFSLHDKPVVNIAFDVADPPLFGMPVWDYYYSYDHFRPVVELGAARFARSADQLAEHVNAYLADPTLDRRGRRRLVELQVGVRLQDASKRVVEVLEQIAC